MGRRAPRELSRCRGGRDRAPRDALQARSARRGARRAPLLRQLRRPPLEGAGEHGQHGGGPQPARRGTRPAPRLHSHAGAGGSQRRGLVRPASGAEPGSRDEAVPRAGARLGRSRGHASAHRRRGEIRERFRHRRRVRLRTPAAGDDPGLAARTLRGLSRSFPLMNRFASLIAMIAAASYGPALAQAQAWPQKPLRVLVGLAPGGNPDTLARMLAAKWGGAFGQQFVVENRPGAGSTIAADLTAKAAPDGYTVLVSDSSVITTAPHLFKSLPYDPFRDLQAVSLAAGVPMW